MTQVREFQSGWRQNTLRGVTLLWHRSILILDSIDPIRFHWLSNDEGCVPGKPQLFKFLTFVSLRQQVNQCRKIRTLKVNYVIKKEQQLKATDPISKIRRNFCLDKGGVFAETWHLKTKNSTYSVKIPKNDDTLSALKNFLFPLTFFRFLVS